MVIISLGMEEGGVITRVFMRMFLVVTLVVGNLPTPSNYTLKIF